MRHFLAFLQRFRIFLVFAVLQIVALSLYFSFFYFPRTQYLTSASMINGKILKVKNSVTKHFDLSHNNDILQKENARLRAMLEESKYLLNHADTTILDTVFTQQYTYLPATVINSTHDKFNNYFTLDVGTLQGVHRDMGVFSDNGIVGVVHFASEHYAVVKSVLTENINVDVMIEESGLIGLLKWDGRDARRGIITGISNDLDIPKWSKVVTRGAGGIFPRGLSVGKVEKVESVEGKAFWNVTVRYSEDYRKLQRVYVITNLFKKEQKDIESLIPPDPEQ